MGIKYSECAPVALFIQHAMRMRLFFIVICGLFFSAIFFFTLFHKRHDFRKKMLLRIKCVFLFSLQRLSK
jgi:H+/Cl- antiporter ClcA